MFGFKKGHLIILLFTFSTSLFLGCQPEMINVLILSGKNNHNWEETTPAIQNILENSGRFAVSVTNSPESLKPDELDKFDVILSNWNTWPEVTGALNDYRLIWK